MSLANLRKSKTSVTDNLLEEIARERVDKFLTQLRPQLFAQQQAVLNQLASLFFKGEKGDRGLQGEPGEDGRDGVNGINGTNGLDGKDGLPGPQGPQGIQGQPGKDGSPDTPLQIADKLNTTEHSVEQKVIKGLQADLLALKRALRDKKGGASGGGMGNVTHQHTSVSSATTTVSTTSKIGGGGFALWVFYNGQMIARGTDYTVGGDLKTLTLLFTPQDSTVLDIIYMRA